MAGSDVIAAEMLRVGKKFLELDLPEEFTLRDSLGFFTELASLNDASSTCSFEVCCLIEDRTGFFRI